MKLFFDMDGTLSVFQTGIGPDVWSAPGYARGLAPLGNMIPAVKLLMEKGENYYGEPIEVYICSAVVSMDYAVEDKKYWLKEQGLDIPEENMIFVPYGAGKACSLNSRGLNLDIQDLFIDDYTKNLKEIDRFTNLTPVKVLNDINDTNKSWAGFRFSAFSSPQVIADTLISYSRIKRSMAA